MTSAEIHNQFSAADYAVFGAMLLVSAGIGVYYAVVGDKQKSTREFLMANNSLRFFPLSLSVLASFFSASTLLGTPAEIYQYGVMYWTCVVGSMLAPVTGALLFGPMFYKLKVLSVFEYLERRYNSKAVRFFGAFMFIVRATVGMGIVLYGPSTALSAVTSFPVWAIIIIVGTVCTFYTTLGGLKAVIWTDVFQTLVMLTGMLAVIIQGCIQLGGIEEVWRLSQEGGRLQFFDFNPDPHIRHTFWTLTIGMYLVWLYPYTVDQQMVQRFSSARSLKDARIALLCNVPGMFIIITLCSLTGLIMFAHYASCDPLKEGRAGNPNQLLPVYVMDILGHLSGLPGLFVACLFSGALSSVSSMLNSLAAVTWEDFLKLNRRLGSLPDSKATLLTKGLAVLYGCLGVGVAFLVKQLGGTVLQASLTLNGSLGAPLIGIFILGACTTSANWLGALTGGIVGFAFSVWLSFGAYLSQPLDFRLSTSTAGCNMTTSNLTSSLDTTTSLIENSIGTTLSPSDPARLEGLQKLYGLSYLWFTALGILSSVFIGLMVSLITGPTKSSEVDDRLLLRLWERLLGARCLSKREDCKVKTEMSHAPSKNKTLETTEDMSKPELEQLDDKF